MSSCHQKKAPSQPLPSESLELPGAGKASAPDAWHLAPPSPVFFLPSHWRKRAKRLQRSRRVSRAEASKSRETFGPEAAPYVMQEKLGQAAYLAGFGFRRGLGGGVGGENLACQGAHVNPHSRRIWAHFLAGLKGPQPIWLGSCKKTLPESRVIPWKVWAS